MKIPSVLGLLSFMLVGIADVYAASAAIGVDLGTEFLKASLVKPGIPLEIVLTKDSRRKEIASIAFKPAQGGPQAGAFPERLYGSDAMALAARFPSEVYPNLKTLLGQPLKGKVAQNYIKRYPALKPQDDVERGTVAFSSKSFIEGEDVWSIEELLAMQLQSVRKNSQALAGSNSPISAAVITVPPYFTIEEKRAVRIAAELAGLEILDLITDGLAVGVNYATSRQFPSVTNGEKPEYHLVFDMGAGSTKATVMKFQSRTVKDVGKFNKTVQEVEVLGYGWDRTLGGDALNALIIDDMAAKFAETPNAKAISTTPEQVLGHGRAVARLTKEAQRLRHILSANTNSQGSFEGLYEDIDFKYKITRAEFEEMASPYIERVGTAIKDALNKSNLDVSDLTSVIIHGGASRTPFVRDELEKIIGSADKIRSSVNSDESAVMGAVFRGAEISPSFRVKEIRLSETAAYPIDIKYADSNGVVAQQRVFSSATILGAPAKEVTVDSTKDEVEATFYQIVDGQEIEISFLKTANLTDSIAKAKQAYSCADSDLQFKISTSLTREDGDVVISRAFVGCETEVKDGIIDGVKNLFGFGKKDQIPLKDAEETEESSSSSISASTGTSSATEASVSSAAPTTEFASVPVSITVSEKGIKTPSKASLIKSRKRLAAFEASDIARREREEALNRLEAFSYKARELPKTADWQKYATEDERTSTLEKASKYSDWVYGDGMDAKKEELVVKLKDLKKTIEKVTIRIEEHTKRPELIRSLQDKLEKSIQHVTEVKQQIKEYENFQAKADEKSVVNDFEGLEDDDPKKSTQEDIIKERGPVPPLLTFTDLEPLEKVIADVTTFVDETLAKVSSLQPTSDPTITIADIQKWIKKLETEGVELSMRGVRNFQKKQKAEQAEKAKAKKAEKEHRKKENMETEQAANKKKTLDKVTEEELAGEIEEVLKKAQEAGKAAGSRKEERDEL